MAIPYWLIGLAIFAALGSFIVFAFRKGMSVSREDRDDMGGLPPGGQYPWNLGQSKIQIRTGRGERRQHLPVTREAEEDWK